MDKEYAGIVGIPEFCSAAAKLAFSENSIVIKDQLVRLDKFYFNVYGLISGYQSLLAIQYILKFSKFRILCTCENGTCL